MEKSLVKWVPEPQDMKLSQLIRGALIPGAPFTNMV